MLHACFLALFVNVIVVLVANAFHRGISSEQNCYRILLSQLLLFVSENIARIHQHIHLVHMQLFTRCFHLLFVVCLIILRKAQVVRYFCAQTAMNMQKANSLFIFSEKTKYYLSKGNNNNVVLKWVVSCKSNPKSVKRSSCMCQWVVWRFWKNTGCYKWCALILTASGSHFV